MKKLLFIFGTRPEAIKMAPLIKACLREKDWCEVGICITAQHRKMLDQVMEFFELEAQFDLSLMKPNQSLFDITANGLTAIEPVIKKFNPELVLVQGDTTTAFIGALAGFYNKSKVAHVEAGLRSGHKYSPYPEEVNRKLVSIITDFHFAPTQKAKENLIKENINQNIFVVGNTVIDALFAGLEKVRNSKTIASGFSFIDFSKKIILVTGHRRESFGEPFENICHALNDIVAAHPDVEVVYPVHLNPNVQEPVFRVLKNNSRIHLIEPLDYPHLIWLMYKCYIVLTDSGGIQEEAPSFGKPVLVMRDVTERQEGIEAGNAMLVGTNRSKIFEAASELLQNDNVYSAMSNAANPYGDGAASDKIVSLLKQLL